MQDWSEECIQMQMLLENEHETLCVCRFCAVEVEADGSWAAVHLLQSAE